MGKLFSVKIKWKDDNTEYDVLIFEFHGINDLPDGYTDDDIFFYGLHEQTIKHSLETGEFIEQKWKIVELHEVIE